ncbi:MAG: hypothetical protein KDD84_03540 [Caldilineaceae bacterium]|nr:hypothetical protein [Caldilineaceae bacterium]
MPPKITQLYDQLELFSEGDPPRHTLFVLGRLLGTPDELLLIDPPEDVANRFSLAEKTAVLFTGPSTAETGLPEMQRMAGGVAHIRIGQHLLDVYTRRDDTIIVLPAVGVLCGGRFGSDLVLPELAAGSDGSEELETLRLLAQLVKAKPPRLFLPHIGSLSSDRVDIMGRLANDVAYLHNLRRVLPPAIRGGDDDVKLQDLAATLLPENRRSAICQLVHARNVAKMLRGDGGRKTEDER